LHDEADERLRVMRQHLVERTATVHLPPKKIRLHPVADVRLPLHHGCRRHGIAVQYRGDADHAFTADRRNFDHAAVLEHGQHGKEASAGKVDVLHAVARSMDNAFEFQRNRIERLSDPLVFVSGQRGK
jgi:hypothetical protein